MAVSPAAPTPHVAVINDVHTPAIAQRSVSWGGIIAGTLIGVAVMIFLALLGAGIGLAAADPAEPGSNMAGISIGASIWFVVSQLIALFVGGYAAARLSGVLDQQKAWLHGATVWALTTVATLYLVATGVSSFVGTGFSAIQSAGSGAASLTQAVIPDDVDLPSFSAPDVAMSSLPPRVQNALREQGVTADNLKQEARQAFRSVVSKREQQRATSVATDVARDVMASPTDAMSDVEAGLDRLMGQGGVFSDEDRKEFAQTVERRFGITPEEAETFVASAEQKAVQAGETAKASIAEARQAAVDAAQTASEAASTAAFWAAVASLLGLLAAAFGAAAGRQDEPVDAARI